MSNLYSATYRFEFDLSFLDVCKIATYFSKDYKPSYFSFHSEVIKREGYSNNFNLDLKNESSTITINVHSISFSGMSAKEALIKYEQIIAILNSPENLESEHKERNNILE